MQIYKTKRKMAAWINVDICCSIASEQHDPLASFYYFLVVEYHALIELRGRECPPTPPLGNSNLLIYDYKVTKNGFRITHPMSYLSIRHPLSLETFSGSVHGYCLINENDVYKKQTKCSVGPGKLRSQLTKWHYDTSSAKTLLKWKK